MARKKSTKRKVKVDESKKEKGDFIYDEDRNEKDVDTEKEQPIKKTKQILMRKVPNDDLGMIMNYTDGINKLLLRYKTGKAEGDLEKIGTHVEDIRNIVKKHYERLG